MSKYFYLWIDDQLNARKHQVKKASLFLFALLVGLCLVEQVFASVGAHSSWPLPLQTESQTHCESWSFSLAARF